MIYKYKAVLFDMDGTLFDSMRAWHSLGAEYLAEKGLALPEAMRDYMHMSCHECARVIQRVYEGGRDVEDIYRELEGRMAGHYAGDVTEKKNVTRLLAPLKSAGCTLAVATWTPRYLAGPALARFSLTEKFDSVFCGDELGVGKDDPEYFRRAAQRIGVKTEECVMCEDSIYAARAAKAAGMGVWAVFDVTSEREHDNIRGLADANAETLTL